MTGIGDESHRTKALEVFKAMYSSTVGSGMVMDYLSQTGLDVIKGADELKKAPAMYESDIEYPQNAIGKSLRDVARVHFADLGTRIFYTQHGGYDNHANEVPTHPRLLTELTEAIQAFFADLRAHDALGRGRHVRPSRSLVGASETTPAEPTMEPAAVPLSLVIG